ncbi:pentatricopeptide repeat-containing protein [Tanacetum coccineum]
MRKHILKIYLHFPKSPNSSQFSRQISSSDNQFQNLIDTHFNSPKTHQNPQISFQNGSDLNQQFESLQNSLSVQKAESCECSDAFVISNALKNDYYMFDENTLKFLAKQVGYSHTLGVYDTLLDVMRCDKDRISDSLLREIRDDDDKEILGKLLNVLVRKCCRNGSWNAALEELNRLKEFGYKGSRVTYNALVRVFLEADKLDSASLVYREMVDVGHKMDVHTLGSFAYSLCKVGKWREALELVENEKFVKDTKLYTRMIGGLCDGSTLLCGCLNKGKLGRCKMILSMMLAEGCYPSDKIFISLVHGYCKSGDFKYAYKLLKETRRYCVRPSPVLYNIFIGGICGTEEMPGVEKLELAEMAYGQMLEGGFVLNKVNVSNYAQCLCEAGKFEKAFNVICEMMTKGFVPDTSTYNKVINFMCDASKIEKAFWLFKEMKKNGVVPNVHTYTMLIDSFCKAGLIPQARIWFDEMLTNGCAPNVVTYTALIHAYLKDNKTKDANELFEMMLSCNCSPNVVTITAIIDGHCKIGQTEKALQIYTRMKGEEFPDVNMYFNDKESNNLDPNVVTYGALVDGLCKAHKVDQAVKLLDVMVSEGCEPNSIVYDALIDGLLKDGKVEEAEGVYTRMCENGYNPNIFTYGAMIDRMFKDNRLDLASRVLSNMLKNSCPPNVVIYTEMVDGLCKVGKTDEAYRLMEMMEEKGCKPNVVTYTAMINGFGIAGKVERSLELFKKMGTKSCAPNYVTYRVLINHCCASGLLDEAHGLLEEMKQTYWPKHMGSYRKVIEGYNRDFLSNLGLLDDVSEYDSVPIIPVYKMLFDSFRKAGKLDVALELHKEMSLLSSQMDKDLYFSLIESLSVSHRVEQAFELYADMISKGIVPELSVLVNLVKGLVKVDRWEDAMQLSQSLCYMGLCSNFGPNDLSNVCAELTSAETILIPFTELSSL